MRAADVLAFLDLCEERGVRIWVDGGWAVDACLGEQTRPHADLDIAIERKDLDPIVDALTARGWKTVDRDATNPGSFVLGDDEGHQVDVHVIVMDEEGRGVMGPPELNQVYPAGSLTGRGTIEGRAVDCVSPERCAGRIRVHQPHGHPDSGDRPSQATQHRRRRIRTRRFRQTGPPRPADHLRPQRWSPMRRAWRKTRRSDCPRAARKTLKPVAVFSINMPGDGQHKGNEGDRYALA